MKLLHCTIVLWCMYISPITPFYHEVSTVKPNVLLSEGSFFGYSIASLDNEIVISAPRADNIGKIFSYDTRTGTTSLLLLNLKRGLTEFNHDYWLGATVTKGSSFFVTCAPRVVEYNINLPTYSFTSGTCFSFRNKTILKLPGKLENTNIFNGNFDSFGWSINVDPANRIMIGGPILNGGYVRVHQTNFTTPYILRNTTTTYNFGYNIASGYFLSDKEITYAVSTTYGSYGEGQVSIFSTDFNEKYRIIGLVSAGVGSMYGATLCSLRLEGSRSSLLIGAPTFTTNPHEYDQGAIYLYVPIYSPNATETLVLKRIINGTSSGGYFGYSIINIGDLDGDSKDEVAIGAPYEDEGKGAVYIYSGHGLISGKPWLQKIYRKESRSFGFSLASLAESYEDVCNGLAISAPLDNKVFLYKCTAYITVNLRTKFPNLQKRENQRYFEFEACIDFIYPTKPEVIDSEIEFKIKITHTFAKLDSAEADGSITHHISLQKRRNSLCDKLKVLTPEEGDYGEMIKYNITADLSQSVLKKTKEKFNRARVLLSDRSVRSLEGQLWAANCNRTYGRCVPHLTLKSETTISDQYLVGSSKEESFSLIISNSGETAYNPCVIVSVLGAHVLSHPPACTRGNVSSQVICKPSQVLPSGYKWSTGKIEIDTSFATNQLDELTIQSDLYDNCKNRTDKKTVQQQFGLIYDFSKINIQGLSNPSKFLNITTVDVTLGKQFHHLYSIRNDAPTDYLNAKFKILLEKRKYLSYSVEVACKCYIIKKNETDSTIEYTYKVEELSRRNETNVYLCINIVPDTLGDLIPGGNVTIPSKLTLYLKEDVQELSVSTTLILKSTNVAAWIIIVAILMGLLILLLMAFILREFGCFQRKNKKKLNSLKEFVRTQSMRQNSRGHNRLHGDQDTDCLT
ncbi:integrin alpha-8-like [Vanessa cardui]|uniref:integrin alpha-8-like n=1 Tax=Vanessa cardui TaxID=171605 RepID=UPI001F12AFC0|nr:integrin alpha-8-like [Vanessa cardui]